MVNRSSDKIDETFMSSVLLIDCEKYSRCLSPLNYTEVTLNSREVLVIRRNLDGTLTGKIFISDDYYYWYSWTKSVKDFQEGCTFVEMAK